MGSVPRVVLCSTLLKFNIITMSNLYQDMGIFQIIYPNYLNRIGIKISPNSECGDKQTSIHSNFRIVQCVNLYYKNTIFNYLTLFIPVSLKDNANC